MWIHLISQVAHERGGVKNGIDICWVSGFLISSLCCLLVRQPEAENIETKENQIYAGQQYTSVQMIRTKEVLLSCSHDDVWSDAVLSGVTDFTDDSD